MICITPAEAPHWSPNRPRMMESAITIRPAASGAATTSV